MFEAHCARRRSASQFRAPRRPGAAAPRDRARASFRQGAPGRSRPNWPLGRSVVQAPVAGDAPSAISRLGSNVPRWPVAGQSIAIRIPSWSKCRESKGPAPWAGRRPRS